MRQAVQERAGQPGVTEHFRPFSEGQVGGDDQRAAQVLLADEGEEHLGPALAEGHEAHLVQDDQLLLQQPALQFAQAVAIRIERTTVGKSLAEGGRVVRGGSWNNDQRNVRAADRGWLHPVNRYDLIGFRCALSL